MTETDIANLPDLAGFEKIKDWFIERFDYASEVIAKMDDERKIMIEQKKLDMIETKKQDWLFEVKQNWRRDWLAKKKAAYDNETQKRWKVAEEKFTKEMDEAIDEHKRQWFEKNATIADQAKAWDSERAWIDKRAKGRLWDYQMRWFDNEEANWLKEQDHLNQMLTDYFAEMERDWIEQRLANDWPLEKKRIIANGLCRINDDVNSHFARQRIFENPAARLVIFGVSGTGKTRALAAGDEVFSDSERLYEVDSTLCHKISRKDITLAEKGCKAGRSAFNLFFHYCDNDCEHHELCDTEENYCLYLGHGTRPVLFIIDDLQEFQSKAHLEFLKEAFDEERLSICAAVQIPEALPEGGLKPWLIEQLGQGRNQILAEAVVRRLLEPENEFVILKKRSTPGTTGSNRGNDTPAG